MHLTHTSSFIPQITPTSTYPIIPFRWEKPRFEKIQNAPFIQPMSG